MCLVKKGGPVGVPTGRMTLRRVDLSEKVQSFVVPSTLGGSQKGTNESEVHNNALALGKMKADICCKQHNAGV